MLILSINAYTTGSYCSIISFLSRVLWIVVCPFPCGHCVVCPSRGYCVVYPSRGYCVVCPSRGHCVVCPPRGLRSRDRMVVGFAIPVQSVAITCNVVTSNPAHGEVFSIQYYIIKLSVTFGSFLPVLRFPPPKKSDRHDITEI